MNNPLRIAIWLATLTVFLVTLAASSAWLPEQVATHFNGAGEANGWMSRSVHLMAFGAFGVLFPAFFIGLFYSIRFLPPSLLNVPNHEYWRAPEHYPDACRFMFEQSFIVATIASMFVTGVNILVVRSNLPNPPHMPLMPILIVTGLFLVSLLFWTIRLIRFFGKTGASGKT